MGVVRERVALGARDADTLTSLANRLIRLHTQMDSGERRDFTNTVGLPANRVAENLLNAFDEDVILSRAQADTGAAQPDAAALEVAQKALVAEAIQPFHDPEVRTYIDIFVFLFSSVLFSIFLVYFCSKIPTFFRYSIFDGVFPMILIKLCSKIPTFFRYSIFDGIIG